MTTTWETKDSGARAEFDSGMRRDTQAGKPRFDLIMPEGIPYEDQLLTRFAALMGRGAEKYTERNWEQANSVVEMARMKSSAFRHFMQWFCGETDEDHAAAVMFNLMAWEATARKVEKALEVEVSEHSQNAITATCGTVLRIVPDAATRAPLPDPEAWRGTEAQPIVQYVPAWRLGRDYLRSLKHLHTLAAGEERCVRNTFGDTPCTMTVGGGV